MKYLILAILALMLPLSASAYYIAEPSIEEFYATSSFVDGKQQVSFFWSAENADNCQLRKVSRTATGGTGSSMIKSVEPDGVYVVSQDKTTTYELYCSRMLPDGFAFDSEEITVKMSKPKKAPQCTLSAKPYFFNSGDEAKLSWRTKNATKVYWKQDAAAVALKLPEGNLRKRGKDTVIYTGRDHLYPRLLVSSKNGTAECRTLLVSAYLEPSF